MAFKAKKGSHVLFGNAGIAKQDKKDYFCTLCIAAEPDAKLERGTGHYFCDVHLSKEQLRGLIDEAEKFLELNS